MTGTFFPAIPVPETQVGLAFETTRGKAEPPAYWIPVMGPKYVPDRQYLPDMGLRGSMVTEYDQIPGLRKDNHGWDQYPYLDTFPVLLKALLGPDHKTTAPSNTELEAEAKSGATTIETKATVAAGSWITIGTTPANRETHLTTAVTGAGPYKVELAYPLVYTHAAKATVTGLTKHRFSLLNNEPAEGQQPKSVTITDVGGEENDRAIPACQLDSLTLSGSADSLTKAAVAWMGNVAETPAEPSPSFTSVEAPPGWTLVTAIGGTQLGYSLTWELSFKRNLKPIPGITGTENYYQFFAGPLDYTGKITVLEDRKATWLSAYEEGLTEAIDLTLCDVKNGYALNVHTTEAKFVKGELDRSKEWVEVPLEFKPIPSATDALSGGVSPVVCSVANATTAEY